MSRFFLLNFVVFKISYENIPAFYPLIFFHGAVLAQDTTRRHRRSVDSSMFANDDTLTRSDYLLAIGRIFQTLNKASAAGQPMRTIGMINQQLDDDDSALAIIKSRISTTERLLNVRNVQIDSR
ncbi:MAG TPA: hypothetical protein VIJ75_16470 [Hanamia sp.]